MSKQKIGILACGNSGIDYIDIDFPHRVVRSTLLLDNKEYEDFVDITADQFYQTIVENPDIDLSTSQASVGLIAETYEEYVKEGYTDLIVVSISSKLSGTYQAFVLAKDLVPELNVRIIDSRSVSQGQMYLIYEAIDMIKEGKSPEVIENRLNELRENITIYVLVDTLKYLVKNGRLSAASGFLGSLLKIKPLLKVIEDGSLVPHEKIRTAKRARERLLTIIKEDILGKKVKMFIAYTNNKDLALSIKEEINAENPDVLIEIVPLTPVVGSHAGPGTLGIGLIEMK